MRILILFIILIFVLIITGCTISNVYYYPDAIHSLSDPTLTKHGLQGQNDAKICLVQ